MNSGKREYLGEGEKGGAARRGQSPRPDRIEVSVDQHTADIALHISRDRPLEPPLSMAEQAKSRRLPRLRREERAQRPGGRRR